MATSKTKTTRTVKPKCNATPCGFTCISAKYNCSSKILARDAAALAKAVSATAVAKSDKNISLITDNYKRFIVKRAEASAPPDEISVHLVSTGNQGRQQLYVGIDVNDSADARGSSVDPSNAVKVAIKAMRLVTSEIAKLPDGVVLTTSAYSADGKGQDRTKLYQKAGFGQVDESGHMFAIVAAGKITAINAKDLEQRYKQNGK